MNQIKEKIFSQTEEGRKQSISHIISNCVCVYFVLCWGCGQTFEIDVQSERNSKWFLLDRKQKINSKNSKLI